MTDNLTTVREALKLAIRQNSHDMLMTGEEIRQCEAALSRLEAAAAAEYERGRQDGMKQEHALWQMQRIGQEIEAAAVPELSREDVVRLAREAGLYVGTNLSGVALVGADKLEHGLLVHLSVEDLQRFASLVRSVPVGEANPVAWSIKCNGHHTGNSFINKEKALTRAEELSIAHPQDVRDVVALVEAAAPQPGDK